MTTSGSPGNENTIAIVLFLASASISKLLLSVNHRPTSKLRRLGLGYDEDYDYDDPDDAGGCYSSSSVDDDNYHRNISRRRLSFHGYSHHQSDESDCYDGNEETNNDTGLQHSEYIAPQLRLSLNAPSEDTSSYYNPSDGYITNNGNGNMNNFEPSYQINPSTYRDSIDNYRHDSDSLYHSPLNEDANSNNNNDENKNNNNKSSFVNRRAMFASSRRGSMPTRRRSSMSSIHSTASILNSASERGLCANGSNANGTIHHSRRRISRRNSLQENLLRASNNNNNNKSSNTITSTNSVKGMQMARTKYNSRIMPERLILVRHGQSEGNVNESIYQDKPDNTLRLTKLGWEQARKAGKTLRQEILQKEKDTSYRSTASGGSSSSTTSSNNPSVHFIISPYVRTMETWHGIASAWSDPDEEFGHITDKDERRRQWYKRLQDMGITWQEDPRIREQDFGNYQDPCAIQKAKKERHRFGVFYYRFPNGESASDVFDRVSTFLDSLWRCFDMNRSKNYVLVTHGISIRVLLARYFHYSIDQFNVMLNPKNCEMCVLKHDGKGKLQLHGRYEPGKDLDFKFHKILRTVRKDKQQRRCIRISANEE